MYQLRHCHPQSIPEKGGWLAKNLNIKSCPFCNAQYTLYAENADKKGLSRFQFDHFFPKNRYPYLSVSLYNLIPSCASCNLLKSDKLTNLLDNYHPFHNCLASRSHFKLNLPSSLSKLQLPHVLNLKEPEITVLLKEKNPWDKKFVEAHETLFNINSIYERHKDVAIETLVNASLYNQYYQNAIQKIRGLFSSKEDIIRLLLGNYMKENEILNRPLSKFQQDIAKALQLI